MAQTASWMPLDSGRGASRALRRDRHCVLRVLGVAHPTFEASASQSEWPTVLGFSATLAVLAVALPVFGRMAGGRWVARLALAAGAAVGTSSVANVIEDGLHMEWAFAIFVLGEAALLVSLMVLTVLIAATRRGADRLLALVPGVRSRRRFPPRGRAVNKARYRAAERALSASLSVGQCHMRGPLLSALADP